MSESEIPTYEEWMAQQEIKIAGLKQMLDAELLASYPYTWRKAQDVPEITKGVELGEWVDIDRRREMSESEIREGEFEWIEVLVPSHLYISIRQIIETFLESHNANDGNGGWNKLKGKQNDN